MTDTPLVGLMEIAVMFGVQQHTTGVWRYRNLLPTPDFMVSTTPIWQVPSIRDFAATSGRAIVAAPPTTRRTPPRPGAGPRRLVGVMEIAVMFGVKQATAGQWRSRDILPPEDYVISTTPVWNLPTIVAFGRETGRTLVAAPPSTHLDGRRPGGVRPAEQRRDGPPTGRRAVGRRPSVPVSHPEPGIG